MTASRKNQQLAVGNWPILLCGMGGVESRMESVTDLVAGRDETEKRKILTSRKL